ncbi:MAG: 3-hydroxyacyl-CoA dehydrogenase NAD-binding domain-containing protein [Thermodesulfobacteriota bacterium]
MVNEKIAVIGAGTMGVQIAAQIANHGYQVTLYGRRPEKLQRSLLGLAEVLEGAGRIPAPVREAWLKGAEKIALCTDLREALREADLAIEAVSEDLALKRELFARIDALAPERAILSTTSSTVPVSWIEDATRRPARCLNLHFYQTPVLVSMVDIMAGTRTAPEVMDAAARFVQSIGCIPLVVRQERLGFGFPRILHSIYQQALSLWAGGVMDFRDLDRAWMLFTGMPRGPFGIMDAIGLDVLYDLLMVYHKESGSPKDLPPQVLRDKIDRRELGMKSGRGFYSYPHPEYGRPDFLNGAPLPAG